MAFASYVFDGIDDVIQHVWSSTATDAERRTLTVSFWAKSEDGRIVGSAVQEDDGFIVFYWDVDLGNEFFVVEQARDDGEFTVEITEDLSSSIPDLTSWHHYVISIDTTQAEGNRARVYVDGALITPDSESATQNVLTPFFASGHFIYFGAFKHLSFFVACSYAFIDVVSGQALTPDAFAFDNGGVWTRKPYKGSYGNFGFSLDGSDGFNDVSGNGFDFTQIGGVQLDPNDLPPFIDVSGASIAPKMMHYRRLRI